MTEEEKIEIINAVLSSLRTNSRTIRQLTPATSLGPDDWFEVSGGRKVSYAVFEGLLESLSAEQHESLRIALERGAVQSADVSVGGDVLTLSIVTPGKTVTCSMPLGEAEGIATLDESGKVPASQLPEPEPHYPDVVEIGGFVERVTLTGAMVSGIGTGEVVYDSQQRLLCLRVANPIPRYYRYWPDREAWCDDDGTPLPGKLYIDTSDSSLYRWDGTALVRTGGREIVTLTEDAYDALEPDDNIIYMIYEDD